MADDKKTTKGPQRQKAIIDTSIIGDDRIKELRTKAEKKIDAERRAAAEAQLLEQFENEARQAGGLDEPMEEVYIDLAPYADRLMLDGVVYFQGHTKTVRRGVAEVIREMSQATWRHQSIVDGKSENFYRKQRDQVIAPSGGGSSHILRA